MSGCATGNIRSRSTSGLLSKPPNCIASRSIDAPNSETNATVAARQSRALTLAVGMCACSFIASPVREIQQGPYLQLVIYLIFLYSTACEFYAMLEVHSGVSTRVSRARRVLKSGLC